MKESSRMPLFDLRKLNASLPVPPVSNCPFEILVLGAKNDFIVVILCLTFNLSNYVLFPPPTILFNSLNYHCPVMFSTNNSATLIQLLIVNVYFLLVIL